MMELDFLSDIEFQQELSKLQAKIYAPFELRIVTAAKINTRYAIAFTSLKVKNEIVALAVLYANPFFHTGGKRTAQIGYFEMLEKKEYAHIFFDKITAYLRSMGYEEIIGPMNGSTWHTYRFHDRLPDRPFFSEPWHAAYYPEFFSSAGFDLFGHYESNVTVVGDLEVFKKAKLADGLRCRNLDMEKIDQELAFFYEISEDAFSKAFLYSPIPFANFKLIYQSVLPFIDPQLVWIIENEKNEAEAFILGLIDHFDPKNESIIIKTIAKRSDSRIRNLINYGMKLLYEKMLERGYKYLVHALIHNKNFASAKASRGRLKGKSYRKYSLYRKEIN